MHLPGVTLVFVGLTAGCFLTSEDEVARVTSPSGRLDAVLVETNGGPPHPSATMPMSYLTERSIGGDPASPIYTGLAVAIRRRERTSGGKAPGNSLLNTSQPGRSTWIARWLL